MTEPPHRPCDAIQPDLAELALGVLGGRDRAVALAHVETCPDCASRLERLSFAADRLLEVGEEVQPPIGFENRVAAHLGWTRRRPSGWWRYLRPSGRLPRAARTWLALASAVFVAAIGFGAGWLGHSGGASNSPAVLPSSAGQALTSSQLMAGGQPRGEVLVSHGTPSWLLVSLNDAGRNGTVICTVTTANGGHLTIGTFQLSSGYGVWGGSLPVPASELRSVSVVVPSGSTVATAHFG